MTCDPDLLLPSTEPLMLNFDADVHYRIAMAPEELQAAGLDRYASM